MREIKFRGLDCNKNWVYGCLVNNMWTFSELTERKGQNCCEIITGKYESDNWEEAIAEETNLIDVVPETVGQYAGIKDGNGKEIYEGDIVKYDHEDGPVIAQVIYKESDEENMWISGFSFKFIKRSEWSKKETNFDIRIIGNIYENTNLLK